MNFKSLFIMQNKYSLYSLILTYAFMIFIGFFFYPKWEQKGTEATISWDASGYYMYLPATFIYKDLKHATYKENILSTYNPTPDFQQAFVHEKSGNYVMKYPVGQSIAMAPSFFVGHFWASNSNIYPADGFSYPYQICLGIGMFLYGILGLWYLRKILLVYFSDKVTALSLLILVIGTNYSNYAAIDQAMTHTVLFTIFTLVIWNTIQFYRSFAWKYIIVLGLLSGWAALIRPTDIIVAFVPLLWGINSFKELKERFIFLFENWKKVLVFSLLIAAVGIIQLSYWKYASCDWIVYSYQDQGFSWLRPHIKNYTMSYTCGWLRYTPMMFLAFIGIVPILKQKINRFAIVFLFLLSYYIVTAWDVWDYGGTSGRAMVQYYPILIFAVAALLNVPAKYKLLIPIFSIVIVLFTYLNIWWLYNAHGGQVKVAYSSREYYWKKVGRWTEIEDDIKLLDMKYVYYGIPKHEALIYDNNFETDTTPNATTIDNNVKLQLNQDLSLTQEYFFDNPNNNQKNLRLYATFTTEEKEWNIWEQSQLIVKFYKDNQEVNSVYFRVHRILDAYATKEIHIDAKLPKDWTKASFHIWHISKNKPLYLDNVKVTTFDE